WDPAPVTVTAPVPPGPQPIQAPTGAFRTAPCSIRNTPDPPFDVPRSIDVMEVTSVPGPVTKAEPTPDRPRVREAIAIAEPPRKTTSPFSPASSPAVIQGPDPVMPPWKTSVPPRTLASPSKVLEVPVRIVVPASCSR